MGRGNNLVYRTGRFARSVKVGTVSPRADGTLNISYTYQTSPYQTFEPGYAQGHKGKDPRALITASIRDIVKPYVEDRFRTMRYGGGGSRGSIR